MLPKLLRRRIRPMWAAAAALGAWSNRRDLARWYRFARRAIDERQRRPMGDLLTEARVRAAISTDPVLRRDRALEDVSVHDGVVTLHTTTGGWPDTHDQVSRLKQVKGITDVTSRMAATGVTSPTVSGFAAPSTAA